MDMAEKDETEGRCPACRAPYDKEKIVGATVNCERYIMNVGRNYVSHASFGFSVLSTLLCIVDGCEGKLSPADCPLYLLTFQKLCPVYMIQMVWPFLLYWILLIIGVERTLCSCQL